MARYRSSIGFVLLIVLAVLDTCSCGNSSNGMINPTPSRAVCDLAQVSGQNAIQYRLLTSDDAPNDSGSTISVRDVHIQRDFPPPTPLSGTFDVVAVAQLPEGMRFAANIVSSDPHSDTYQLSAPSFLPGAVLGTINASTIGDRGVDVEFRIASEFLVTVQDAPAMTIGNGCPPTIDGLELFSQETTSMRYARVRLSAVPEP